MIIHFRSTICFAASVLLSVSVCFSASFLWDASRENMAGNADWVIDADSNSGNPSESNPSRFPSPSQSNVTSSTPESYWRGMNSEWAIRLVKAGHSVETLPRGATISFGTSATQDLSNYDVYILNEPQELLSSSEKQAVFSFIENGGGVLMVADHCGSDRNHSGWDSPRIFNNMDIENRLGVAFFDDPDSHDCDFTQNIFRVSDSASDPIINGPFGEVTYIKYNGTTEIEVFPSVNSTVKGHAWRNPGSPSENRYMVVSCLYGDGRVAFVPDSSPTSDGTGDPNDTSYGNTFNDPDYENDYLFLNICAWLADGAPTRPTPTPSIPTPTPTASSLHGVDLELSQTKFSQGDDFLFSYKLGNQEDSTFADLYIALDVAGLFWFYPGWTADADWETLYLSQGSVIEDTVFSFVWPEVEGYALGLKFWGAAVTPEGELVGTYDMIEWGYE